MAPIAGETLQVYFLGTAGALPTVLRNPACYLVRRGSDTLLFDCGEGAQQQMMRAQTGFTIDAIFITHWHADHYLGLLGLVQTLAFNGRAEPLALYGPPGLEEIVHVIEHLSTATMRFPVQGRTLRPGDEIRVDGYTVRAFGTRHGMQSLGYALIEERPARPVRPRGGDRARRPAGPALRPAPARRDRHGHGRRRARRGQARPGARPGPARAFDRVHRRHPSGRPGPRGPSRGLDLLIHDATYADADTARAADVHHATAGEAGEAAARLGAKRLALVHLSSRYTSTADHLRDAAARFSGEVLVPDDLVMLELPFSDR